MYNKQTHITRRELTSIICHDYPTVLYSSREYIHTSKSHITFSPYQKKTYLHWTFSTTYLNFAYLGMIYSGYVAFTPSLDGLKTLTTFASLIKKTTIKCTFPINNALRCKIYLYILFTTFVLGSNRKRMESQGFLSLYSLSLLLSVRFLTFTHTYFLVYLPHFLLLY